jgi:Flp pilus assembly pilin Flp
MRLIRRFRDNRVGAMAVEYALLAGLIAIALLSAMGPIDEALFEAFQSVAEAVPQP